MPTPNALVRECLTLKFHEKADALNLGARFSSSEMNRVTELFDQDPLAKELVIYGNANNGNYTNISEDLKNRVIRYLTSKKSAEEKKSDAKLSSNPSVLTTSPPRSSAPSPTAPTSEMKSPRA